MYHYARGNMPVGPVSKEQLAGNVGPTSLVWREGLSDWVEARTLPELADLFGGVAAPVIAPSGASATPMPVPPIAPPVAVQYQTPIAGNGPPGMATASMVLGIIGLCTMPCYGSGGLLAVLAVVFGFVARSQGASAGRPGSGQANAGIIMGCVVLGLILCFIILVIVIPLVFGVGAAAGGMRAAGF
jgi:hypothetical protein